MQIQFRRNRNDCFSGTLRFSQCFASSPIVPANEELGETNKSLEAWIWCLDFVFLTGFSYRSVLLAVKSVEDTSSARENTSDTICRRLFDFFGLHRVWGVFEYFRTAISSLFRGVSGKPMCPACSARKVTRYRIFFGFLKAFFRVASDEREKPKLRDVKAAIHFVFGKI